MRSIREALGFIGARPLARSVCPVPGVLVSLVQNTDAMRRFLDMPDVLVSLVQNTDAMRRTLEEIERRLAGR